MTPTDLSDPIYTDELAAQRHLEALRWGPDTFGLYCPRCGATDSCRELGGESMGQGWFYCSACQDKFTVRTGTVYERSHIPLHKWLLAFRLMASSKKGVSAHQIHRTLGITYKSAWFMAHRIREAMRDDDPTPLGGKDKTVEVDETFTGPSKDVFVNGKGWQKSRSPSTKATVLSLVERGGKSRSIKLDTMTKETVRDAVEKNLHPESTLHTDQARMYKPIGKGFAKHETVNHSEGEYARGTVTTNTVEGFFSIFKRGMTGVYQHCDEKHLQRYLNEFDFRYSNRSALGVNDAERTELAIRGATGKRLTYRRTNGKTAA